MSLQAYLDTIEKKTGKIPQELLDEAHEPGFDATSKAADVCAWLKEEYELGRGHAMALFHVLKNGTGISDKHVDSGGAHSDPSNVLRLDGIAHR